MITSDNLAALDLIQYELETQITYAAIVEAEDLYHEEEDSIVRAFTFNQGEREEVVIIGSTGAIHKHWNASKKRITGNLIMDVISTLFGILDQLD